MATNYPGSLDTSTQQPSPSASTEMDDAGYEHDAVHTNHSGAIIALETKLGTGSSTAVANSVLAGTGSGTSGWTTTPTVAGLTTTGNIDGPQNFTVGNGEGEFVYFQGSSNQVFVQANGTYRAYWNSSGHYLPYANDSYEIGASSLRWKKAWFYTVDVADDLYVGANGRGDSWMHFYDDNSNTWRTFGWDDSENRFYFEGNIAPTGNTYLPVGSAGTPAYSFASDSNTGIYRYGSDSIGFATGGAYRGHITSNGLHLASGDWFRVNGSSGIYWQTYGGGWNMSDTSWIRAYGSKGIVIPGGMVATLSTHTSTTGYKYVQRNTTYGTLSQYNSSRDFKDNITNVTASDAAAWIDSLQPVTFVSKWMSEEEEPEAERAWREADVQVGFIAEDVLANSTSAQFAQVEDVDGTLKGAGWKWECVIAAAVAEIKSLRARVADLEAA